MATKPGPPRPKKTWQTLIGRERSNSERPCKIDFFEKARSFEMDSDKQQQDIPFGLPITAKHSIELISRFHEMLAKPALERFLTGKYISFEDMKKRMKYTDKDIERSYNDLVSLLRKSCAATIDKSILLKTISQPECEGVRFYLCKARKNRKDFISLVTVGVNREGKDHLYDYIPDKLNGIETKSLTSEYAHPPDDGDGKDLKEVFPDQYVLLNYATDLTLSRKTAKAKKTARKKK
jgi:hypothetical protein